MLYKSLASLQEELKSSPRVKGLFTKEHQPSYLFALPDDVLLPLVQAARNVGKIIDRRLEDVGRTGMIAEGFGIDHAHIKLFPMHGTRMPEWRPIKSNVDKFFERYEGYMSSHDYKRADDGELAELAKRIRT